MKLYPEILTLFFAISLSLISAGQTGEVSASLSNTPPPGFAALWNGRDLTGWWGADTEDPRGYTGLPAVEFQTKRDASLTDIRKHWLVRDGELVNDGKGLFLTTEQYFGDFELLVDYKTVPLADSGIYLRGCPQVQIWDSTDKKKFAIGADKGSGGLWNNSPGAPGKDPLVKADKPFAQWNRLRIVMVGSRVWVWLNGQPTVDGSVLENYFDRKLPVPSRGPIQLQTHGGEISWRNVFIREIGGDEANRLLRGTDPEGFSSIFNGRDLTGWTGQLDCVNVTGSAIVWQPGKGGVIHTQKEYADFVVRLEFKLPPGGNNGLAIRYPGSGNPANEAMCECQVLDDHYEQATGSKIDPRQAHGSAYGMVAALRGYQRPAGEWNYQEVAVSGSTIKVELNGTRILDADLSQVTEFMEGYGHPGRNRKSGYFGFAGHNDPVAFRNISIKPLD
ncbi:MAG: DUF1080 domain-containing protein [Luteolibacter sp.]|jgi:hypothetical protein|nr:DUF1080 domain-containing protein [Luteolibacter sp.]